MWSSLNDRSRPLASSNGSRLALAAASLALSGCVSGPVRTFRSSYERTKSAGLDTQSQSNLLEFGQHDRLGPDLEYRLDDKITFATQWLELDGPDSRDEATLHQPTFDLAMTSGPLIWSQTYRIQEDRSLLDAGADNRLVRKDALQKLEWSPLDLPQLAGWINYRTVEDDAFVDQERLETRLQVNQAIGAFSYEYGLRDERVEDVDTNVESERVEHTARGSYDDRHLGDALSTSLSVFLTERRSSVAAPSGSNPTVQLFPTQGFSDVDLTPQISTLTSNNALVDGNVAASAGIDIGGFASGGQLSWNIAANVPTGSSVDVVQLKTVSAVPPNFTSGFSFSVWASDDNTFWTLVASAAAYVYDPVNQHFRLTIPGVSQRFLKVVNTSSPAAAPAVLVSEIEFLASAGPGPSSTVRGDEALRSATGAVSWRASDALSVGYDVFAQTAEMEVGGATARDETRFDHGLWAALQATREIEANLRVSNQTTRDDELQDESLTSVVGVLTYRPLATLDFDLSHSRTDREVDGDDDVATRVTQALATAQLLRTLRGELLVERNELEDVTDQRDISRWIASAALVADLTTQVEWTLRARNDDARVTGSGASQIPDPSEERYESTLLYRPTEQFIAELELRWIETFAGDGLDERLRVDWIPFADGAIDLQLDYDRTRTQSFTDSRYDRYRGRARYTLDSHTYLELQYAAEVPDTGTRTEILALSFVFNA